MSDGGRRALLVVHPASGPAQPIATAIAALEAGGITLLRREAPRGGIDELILSARNDVDCVIVVGGDGALSAGAIALRDTGLPLGILPYGPVNDLASALGIPDDPDGAAAVILAGQTQPVALGSVNGRPFVAVASVGLSIEAARHLSHSAGRSMGQLRFQWAALRLLFQHRRFSAIIRCGSIVHRVRTMQVTVAQGRFYMGGMPPPRTGALGDGLLSVYSLEPLKRWGLLFMRSVFLSDGNTLAEEARQMQSPVIEVVTRLPQPIMADGEVVAVTPARFSVLPQTVRVFAPPQADPSEQSVMPMHDLPSA